MRNAVPPPVIKTNAAIRPTSIVSQSSLPAASRAKGCERATVQVGKLVGHDACALSCRLNSTYNILLEACVGV